MVRLFKHESVRDSATTGLDASSRLPNSGFAFATNSTGASASIADFSRVLNDLLGEIEFGGEASEFARLEIERLEEQVSKYPNSRLSVDASHPKWSCGSEDLPLLLASAKCAAAIYEPKNKTILTDDTYHYDQLEYSEPSILGTVKASAFYMAQELNSGEPRNLLIIAIRGSASKVDHMVNINNRATDIGDFISLPIPQILDSETPQVHSGFLLGANALVHRVKEQLDICKEGRGPTQVLFTGHSAGAAVASLLFQHFLSISVLTYPSLTFSCITFGSPPFCNTRYAALTHQARLAAKNCRLYVNFLNEFDLVPRLDRPYVFSLIDIYRERFRTPPIDSDNNLDGSHMPEIPASSDQGPQIARLLPDPVFVHPEDIVVLSLRNTGLKAIKIDSETLSSLLFCGIEIHKVAEYMSNMEALCVQEPDGKAIKGITTDLA